MILLITVIGGICDIVSLCVTALLEENGLSYQQKLGSHILYGRRSAEGQEVEGQGHMVVKIVTVACCWWSVLLRLCAAAAGVGLHVVWLLRFLVCAFYGPTYVYWYSHLLQTTSVFSGRVERSVRCVCLSGQLLSNEMIFDLDIRHTGSAWTQVNLTVKVKVRLGVKNHRMKTFQLCMEWMFNGF